VSAVRTFTYCQVTGTVAVLKVLLNIPAIDWPDYFGLESLTKCKEKKFPVCLISMVRS